VPEISRFFGIVIAMYFDDHAPPHFHARYGNRSAAIEIHSLRILQGSLPPRVRGLVTEWAASRKEALMEDWELARRREPLKPIEPLT
jgi:hypothetical protein